MRSRFLAHALMLALAGAPLWHVAVPSLAHAEDAITRTAKRHFAKGEKLFALGQFEEALEEYQLAFDAKPIPGILFNIGQCYRNLGDFNQAVFSFRKYLTLDPNAANREAVEQLIAELETKNSVTKPRPRPGKEPVEPVSAKVTPSDKPIWKKWWFWTGVGVVAAAGAGTYYVVSQDGVPQTSLGNIPLNK